MSVEEPGLKGIDEWASGLDTKGRVATLGMFIIDHFEVKDESGHAVQLDEAIGGGGIFAMVAARMFLPPTHCALIVDQGDDFPEHFRTELEAFGAEMTWFRHRTGKTTRALNMYSGARIGEGHQSFRYLSPQLQLTPKDLFLAPSPFAESPPEWIHVVCVTERARTVAVELEAIHARARLVWEPLGVGADDTLAHLQRCCTPDNLEAMLDIITSYAVFSPNLVEMQALLGIDGEGVECVEQAAHDFARRVRLRHPNYDGTTIIVRAGALGSYTLSAGWCGWVPAFWSANQQKKVVDVTGGGNSWLGGLCAGLLLSDGDMRTASIFGSVAASFAIEQRGLPRLTCHGEHEMWNGDDPWRRLRDLSARIRTTQ